MGKRNVSLEQWCKDNHREELLKEWNKDKNSVSPFPLSPSTTEYCTATRAWWKCKNGHEWYAPINKRTTFRLGCPICDPTQNFLPIGTKYGCLKITNVPPANDKDPFGRIFYECVCDCGKEVVKSETEFLDKKHRYCTETIRRSKLQRWAFREVDEENKCGLKKAQEEKKKATYKREFDPSYDNDYTSTIHESLEIIECINDHYEELHSVSDERKNGGGTYYVYKLYRCRCYLCGKEQQIKSSEFSINPPTKYGCNAYNGYWSDTYCDCHKISSFQWIVTKLLKENGVPYRVEVSFKDLYGICHINHLRYDFAIYGDAGNIKCLIECQGEQHYVAVAEFGGDLQFERQQKNDELKRKYARDNGIPLYEISFKNKKYEAVEKYLREIGIIS